MPAEVRIGVESFGREITVWSAPTLDRAVVRYQLGGLTSGGGTPLHDAMIKAAQAFTPAAQHKAIVLLSDGGDRDSVATLDQAVGALAGIHVEAVSLTTAETDLATLSRLGTVTSADDPSALQAVLLRLAALLIPATVEDAAPPATAATTTTAAPVTTAAPPTTAAVAPSTVPAPVIERPAPAPAPRATAATPLWIGGGVVFLALFALVLIAFPPVRVSKRRLGIASEKRSVSETGKRAVTAVDQLLERRGKRRALENALDAADISMRPGELVSLVTAVAAVLGLVGLAIGGPLLAAILAGVTVFATRAVFDIKSRKRRAAFAALLPDVLQLLTSSLRSGYGMTQALDAVAAEAQEPARAEFQRVLLETRVGRDLTEAMSDLAERMQSPDMEWVVSAMAIHQETGGNLAEILETVGGTIRERQRMVRQVATLTAEGRISAYILTGLPFVLAGVLKITNPDYFDELSHGGGLIAVTVAGGLMVVGWIWMRRLVNIKV
jgi:tight adherence protein B